MDAKIGLDTNYQKERHLCKFTRSLNFSSTETEEEERRGGEVEREGERERQKLPSLIPTDETLILVWLESSAKTQTTRALISFLDLGIFPTATPAALCSLTFL